MQTVIQRLAIVAFCAIGLGSMASAGPELDALISEASESRTSDPSRFAELLDELNRKRVGMSPDQADFVDYLTAYRQAFSGKFAEAINGYRQVLDRSGDPTLSYRVGYSLVNVYSITRNWTAGLVQLNETMRLQDQVVDYDVLQSGRIGAAIFYNQLEQFELALDLTDRLIDQELSDRNLCFVSQLQIEARLNLGLASPDSRDVADAMARCRSEPVAEGLIRVSVAQSYVDSDRALSARQVLEQNLTKIESTGYKRLIAEAYGLLSQSEFALGNGPQAVRYAEMALEHAEGFPMSEPALQAYWTLKEFHRQQESYQAALDYEVLYARTKEGIQDERAEKQLAIELAQRDVVQKNQQIELLKQQNSVLQLSEQLASETAANDRLLLYFAIVLAAILAGWGHYLYRTQKRLRSLAERDAVTGLNNRRHFTEIATRALHQCKNRKTDACFVMLDLDRFKRVNDTYGHSTGDLVLKSVAEVLDDIACNECLVGRLGGEEFALLMPDCDLDSGATTAEHCRRAIESIDCTQLAGDLTITASFGITSLSLSGARLERLMRDADSALYQAKNQGRNQVARFSPDEPALDTPGALPSAG